MSHDRLKLSEETGDGSTCRNRRRQWVRDPVGGRKESMGQRPTENLWSDKERSKTMIRDVETGHERSEFSSDSGVSLCNSMEREDRDALERLKSLVRNGKDDKWSVDSQVFDIVIPPKASVSDLINGPNRYQDLKEFYTSRCFDVESRSSPSEEKLETDNSGKDIFGGRWYMKRSTRSADISAAQKPWTSGEKRISDGPTRSSEALEQDPRIKETGASGCSGKSDLADSDAYLKLKRTFETSLLRAERSPCSSEEVSPTTNRISARRRVEQSPSTNNISNVAKSLIHLAQIKRSNKHAVANFLKNFSESSEGTWNARKDDRDESFSQDDVNDPRVESLKFSFPNSNRKREEKLRPLSKTESDRDFSIKLNLDRRSISPDLKKTTFESFCSSNASDTPNNEVPENVDEEETLECETEIARFIGPKHSPKTVEETSVSCDTETSELEMLSLASDMKLCSGDGTLLSGNNIRDMNTQSALIYLSETLIESAQRAEMLLMQKMKEYNDLVCREMPDKRRQDFSCQVEMKLVRDRESELETRSNQTRDNLLQELSDKKHKIEQLEWDKKKLRQALKKMHWATEKQGQAEAVPPPEGGGEDEGDTGEKDTCHGAPMPVAVPKQRNENHQELVQALKIENNLLHTLLKEMKTELDQENATILSLAKKLELSLGKQTQVKVRRHQTDVVRRLEDKLEQQERTLKQEAMEARAVAKYVIMKYKKLIEQYKEKVKSHQETVDRLTNALK